MIVGKLTYTALYAGNQALSVITTVVVIRYGKEAFTLSWILGSLLALGWGATLFGMAAPALVQRLWTLSYSAGFRRCTLTLIVVAALVLSGSVIPVAGQSVAEVAGLSVPWVVTFVLVGLIRSYAHALSTYPIREGLHANTSLFQFSGRIAECGLALWGCLLASPLMLVGAWLAYPLSQLALVLTNRRAQTDATVSKTMSRIDGVAPVFANSASQALDLVAPTLWLKLGGDSIFIAYRAVTAALSYSALIPRYWYVVAKPTNVSDGIRVPFMLLMMTTALVVALVYQWGSGAVPTSVAWWSVIPLILNGVVMPTFSRLRQFCLNQGWLTIPALAIIGGRLAELGLLVAFASLAFLPADAVIIALTGFTLSAPFLTLLHRTHANKIAA